MSMNDLSRLWSKYGKHPGRFISTFLDNRRVFLRGARPRRGPLAAVFNVSPRCDARCRFCDYWKIPPTGKKIPTTEEKIRLIRDLAGAGVWLLSFCSAEPLLEDDLSLLVIEAKRRKMIVNVSTNASRLAEKAEMLAATGVDTVSVSMDSHIPAVHNDMRGFPGLFEKAEKGIACLADVRRGRRPWITVRHLLNRNNYFFLQEFVKYWKPKCDDIVFKPVLSSQDGVFHVPEDMRARPEDEGRFRESFKGLLEKYPELDNVYHRAIPDHLFGGGLPDKWYCFAGTFFTDIDCEGNIYPCAEYGENEGNMVGGKFLDIWTSENMARFRKGIKFEKRCEGCWGDKFASGIHVQNVLGFLGGV